MPALHSPSEPRSAGQPADPFLPPNYLRPTKTFDVGPSARGGDEGSSNQRHDARPDEVLVLELADGSTFITSAGRLQDTLAVTHPEMLEGDQVLLEKLRMEAAAPQRSIGQAAGGMVSKVYSHMDQADGHLRAALKKASEPQVAKG